jgi:hypothetical protein
MPVNKEEMAKGEAQLLAEEIALKKKWCALKGHRWDLPSVSPFNHDLMECAIICNRCNAHAKVVVTVDVDPADVPPAAVAPPVSKKS